MNTHTPLLQYTRSSSMARAAKLWREGAAALLAAAMLSSAQAGLSLPDQPVFSSTGVPGNLALALSVEFPTAISVAHIDPTYVASKTFLGYFDPNKCYVYIYNADETQRYFSPSGDVADPTTRVCTGKWSGNFLNWATMQTIDPFRWALTGGYRVKDTATETWLEKAYASNQGGDGNFPNKGLATAALVSNNTPFGWSSLNMRVKSLGNKMRFTRTGDLTGAIVAYGSGGAITDNTVYEVSVRVKVCDNSGGAGTLEANCTAFPSGVYKPMGLLQKYAEKIRYSAFGYLNDDNLLRDGGVLRARQKFVGPLVTQPNAASTANAATEWDANTGVMAQNPDATDASATTTTLGVTINNSGVMNYLNKFGELTPANGYKSYDPVGELYYAAIRYFKNLGNVPEWTSMTGATAATKALWADGFPVITDWDDPLQYSCQRNFILGIGDVNTHADKNVPGSSGSTNEPTKPAAVTADTSVDAVVATNKVGSLHGMGASLGTAENINTPDPCCNNNSALMAGLAYDAHTRDIRPDDATKPQTRGMQTISTYWLDILEYSTYKANNQFYLAAKYGGFKVPIGYLPYAQATDIPANTWWTTGETFGGQNRPDNYYVAAQPDLMVSGLQRAFASIAAQLRSFSTSFSLAAPQVASSGTTTYSAQYDSGTWSGEVVANAATFTAAGQPQLTPVWSFTDKLTAQLLADGGTGWNTNRRIATFNTSTKVGVPFRFDQLHTTQQSNLNTVYRSFDDSADYLKYLRGDATHEESSTAAGSAKIYRDRAKPLGDIVGSKLRVVGPPTAPFSSAANPGYSDYKIAQQARKTMVYVGSNDGMLHAINGSIDATDTAAGTEVFAYVPGSLYAGPTGAPATDGLQTRGDPDFTHRYFVDGNPSTFDIDFGRTVGGAGTDWRTILVGGLGKGGKSYYAIDVTDPAAMTTEAAVAGKVLWEFSHAKLGHTYGEPIAVKTRKYGWVLVFGSGYNNSDGQGYFFIVNPRTGALLEPPIATGVGSLTTEAGLAHVQAYVPDRTDNTAETLYAGDLLGNLWRVDVTGTTGNYPSAMLFATLTNRLGEAVPVTSRPLVVIQPYNNRRWVVVGSGRLLTNSDKSNSQGQGFFAFMDGNNLRTNSAAQLPTGISFPLTRSKLRELTDLTTRVTLDLSTEIGWWVDLGATAGLGWRVISDPSSFYGEVSFSTMVPTITDACSPKGQGRIYTIDLGTGKTKLLSATNTPMAYASGFSGAVTDLRNLSVDGNRALGYGTENGETGQLKTEPRTPVPTRRINWRELQLAD
jgi:type IV pilus assembly protein PilY1